MADHSHIFLHEGNVDKIEFTPKPKNFGEGSPLPERDVQAHAASIRSQYEACVNSAFTTLHAREEAGKPSADGLYLDIELKGKNPPYDKLDGVRGPQLMNISKGADDETNVASIYLSSRKNRWLTQKLDQYEEPVEEGTNPKNQPLINSIETIVSSTARSLFPNKAEYDELLPMHEGCFEIWLDVVDDEEIEKSKRVLNQLGISLAQNTVLKFEHVTVLLVNATKEALDDIPLSLDYV